MTDPRIITLAEMAKHDTRADCWMAHNGQVYDVTKFLEDHPGGPEIMLEHSGAGDVPADILPCCLRKTAPTELLYTLPASYLL